MLISVSTRNICIIVSITKCVCLFFLSRSWLDNNGKSAVRKLKDSLPLRKELDRLKDDLSNQLQLSDIR